MAKKKEGSRRGSSAKPKRHIRNLFRKRGAGRAPSADTSSDSENIITKGGEQAAEQPQEKAAGARHPREASAKDVEAQTAHEEEINSDYRTVIDNIVELVNQRESVTLTEISKAYGISYARLEGWGRILDKSKFLELEYPMVGDVMLRIKGYAKIMKERHKLKKAEKGGNAKPIAEDSAQAQNTQAAGEVSGGEANNENAVAEVAAQSEADNGAAEGEMIHGAETETNQESASIEETLAGQDGAEANQGEAGGEESTASETDEALQAAAQSDLGTQAKPKKKWLFW